MSRDYRFINIKNTTFPSLSLKYQNLQLVSRNLLCVPTVSLQNLRKLTTGAKYHLRIYLSMTAIMSVRETVVSKSNFTPGQSWGALRKAWKGYRIAKVQSDNAKMSEYATKIRKLQGELGISVASFPHLGIN